MIIAILTGERPELLARTLDSFYEKCPNLAERNKVVIYNNSGDQPTRDIINNYVFDMVYESPYIRSCGEAYSFIARQAQMFYSDEEYLLFLEDDWECVLPESQWLNLAVNQISHKNVSQVRLRDDKEWVQPNHMVTREPILWEQKEGFRFAPSAHLTFNPSLVKINDLKKYVPASGERHAQKIWTQKGMKGVVQLTPGVFKHIGGRDSLRARTKCQA